MSEESIAAAVHRRWRLRLAIAVVLMALGALASTAISAGYGESLVVPVLLWVGVVCIVMAWRSVPHGVRDSERPAMARSAIWTVLGLLAYVVGPLLVSRF
ncbi:hypothetical protein ncot_17175 [Nocardioides sp. JQ2195]|uniref:hypothetical protein n=1 Tax=Nocardioides sp. JQ2195 TaxID=2592334 RepID=UPI00143E3A70|nr:hypothetical protein [Nocardioides sp. JQ2195]QIX28128.1 hypothetical protein ncot_17175 [Nocardioides sp. JQ2195]